MRAPPAIWPGPAGDVEARTRREYSRRLAVAVEAARNQADAADRAAELGAGAGDGRAFDFGSLRAQIMAEMGLSEADVQALFAAERHRGAINGAR